MATRGSLRLSTRVAANQEGSDFPSEDALNDILDRAASSVYRRLIAAGWNPSRTTISITATGATSYVLGTDVHSVTSVQRLDGSLYRPPLTRLKPEELPGLQSLGSSFATCYSLTGGVTTPTAIELYPTPTSGSYEVRYTPRFAGFLSDSDPWYGPDGSDELIILTAAIESCALEYGDTSQLERKLESRWNEVVDGAQWQDAQGQQTVRDIYARRNQRTRGFDYDVAEVW